jgi:hypothetical protein
MGWSYQVAENAKSGDAYVDAIPGDERAYA